MLFFFSSRMTEVFAPVFRAWITSMSGRIYNNKIPNQVNNHNDDNFIVASPLLMAAST